MDFTIKQRETVLIPFPKIPSLSRRCLSFATGLYCPLWSAWICRIIILLGSEKQAMVRLERSTECYLDSCQKNQEKAMCKKGTDQSNSCNLLTTIRQSLHDRLCLQEPSLLSTTAMLKLCRYFALHGPSHGKGQKCGQPTFDSASALWHENSNIDCFLGTSGASVCYACLQMLLSIETIVSDTAIC